MSVPLRSAEFIVQTTPQKMSAAGWRCTEDRPRKGDLPPGPQIAGARSGIVAARILAAEIKRPGSFIDEGSSVDAVEEVAGNKINAGGHEHCAGRTKMPLIIGHLATNPGTVYSTAKKMMPSLRTEHFAPVIGAAERMMKRVPDEYPEIAPLTPLAVDLETGVVPEHQATDMYVIHNDTAVWDTETAWRSGNPGYGFNVGSLPELHQELSDANLPAGLSRPVDTSSFVVAGLVYQAATANNLPLPAGAPGLNIHLVGSELRL